MREKRAEGEKQLKGRNREKRQSINTGLATKGEKSNLEAIKWGLNKCSNQPTNQW